MPLNLVTGRHLVLTGAKLAEYRAINQFGGIKSLRSIDAVVK
jgi:hypothetical protein